MNGSSCITAVDDTQVDLRAVGSLVVLSVASVSALFILLLAVRIFLRRRKSGSLTITILDALAVTGVLLLHGSCHVSAADHHIRRGS